jgi:hypothetical protein
LSTQSPQQYPSNPYSPQSTLGPPNKPVGTTTASGGGGWKWLIIILGIGGVGLIACCGACGGFTYFGFETAKKMIKDAPPYKMAMEKVRESPEVKDKIGQPITDEINFSKGAQTNQNNNVGNMNFTIDIKGPNGAASVKVSASTEGQNKWDLDDCTVTFADGSSVNLAGSDEAAPTTEVEGSERKEEGEPATAP